MFAKIIFCLALLLALPAWSQVDSSATGAVNTPDSELPDNDLRMKTPPPVSGKAYPTEVGSQARSNYLSGGINFNTAYNSNVYAGGTGSPVSDMTYSIFPTIAFKRTTSRQVESVRYSPGFTFYQDTTSLNAVNQFANVDFEYRPSPHTTLSLGDTFQQNSNPFTQPGLSGTTVSGSTQNPTGGLIAPYAKSIREDAWGTLRYQFDRNGMIGGGGNFQLIHYPNPEEAAGLYDSTSGGGTGFYNRRLSGSQYLGVTYQYSIYSTSPVSPISLPGTTSQTNSIFLFYTRYLNSVVSFSVSGGPQHLNTNTSGMFTTTSWTPGGMVSMGWQTNRSTFAANYSYTLSAGDGLRGPYNSNNANVSGSWKFSRLWTAELAGAYAGTKSATDFISSSTQDGSTFLFNASLERAIGEHLTLEGGYQYLYENYNQLPSVSISPNNNREYVSVGYTFSRPLGR